jgi:predicted nuclease with RNAse H fold
LKRRAFIVVGVDLAGVPHRPSGICLLESPAVTTTLLYDDEEIVAFIKRGQPSLVAVDAPLNLPPGRRSMAEQNRAHFRPCDEELRRRRIPFFPITLGPMRMLTERGIKLKKRLERQGFRVVEIYPGGAQDIWRIPRARKNLAGLREGLVCLGLKGLGKGATDHELDAATGALVGLLFLQKKAEVLGNFRAGAIIMPRSDSSLR